ncbi:E3 ubiquitin-protein ligase TRIP12 [Sarcoptes scabiei]|uniref:E3 ubiquitin-protein ligase n=1 Tax=Sarcoptes scabiei TaxID=52283 RepID=A0A834R6R2_SARSC|nr:E3 ubiquitin-protein ligase TRIP12 [Sarcoptes scabiei]
MADRPFKAPKKEGTSIESSVKKRSFEIKENKSRSPIITRSQSKNKDDVVNRSSLNGAINRNSKRSLSNTDHSESDLSDKSKKIKAPIVNIEARNEKKTKKIAKHQPITFKPETEASNLLSESSQTSNCENRTEKLNRRAATQNPNFEIKKSQKKTKLDLWKNPDANIDKLINIRIITTNVNNSSTVMDQNGSQNSNLSTDLSSATSPSTKPSPNPITTDTASVAVNNPIVNSYATDDNNEESEMNRLHSMLEPRQIHQHFLGINRMQNLFIRSFNNSSNTKAQQILNALNGAVDEDEKLHYVIEMCQLLLMGNEDTLIFRSCARCDSSFFGKASGDSCMDVAEQSLKALEMLSRRHNKAILHARGVSACLTYLDFFSIDAQRSALTITANCFQNLTLDDFQYVQDSLSILGSHLTIEDKKCIESICLAFYRLVECYQYDNVIISDISSIELLGNIQNILMTIPPILSAGPFVNVIRMLSIMCFACSRIAVDLLKLNICETLKCLLLCGDNLREKPETMNLISRSSQEISELTSFIAELLPSLPLNGIFGVDLLFNRGASSPSEVIVWQWKDNRGLWQAFNPENNKQIESAHQSGEDEFDLHFLNRNYILDFNSMQKICEDTGKSYAIQRKTSSQTNSELLSRTNLSAIDPRSEFFKQDHKLAKNFVKFVFKVLNEVYNNSGGLSVRYKCLNAILRIIYYAPKELLRSVLQDQSISSSIATMLSSHDLRIVVSAVQMCDILMEKMPEIFLIYFQREGVIHQIRKLYLDETRFGESKSSLAPSSSKEDSLSNSKLSDYSSGLIFSNPTSIILEKSGMIVNRSNDIVQSNESLSPNNLSQINQHNLIKSNSVQNVETGKNPSRKNDELVKRKRTRKSITFPSTRSTYTNHGDCCEVVSTNDKDLNICSSLSATCLNNLPLFINETINSSNLTITSSKNSNRFSSSSRDFLQRLNPSRWTRWTQNAIMPNSNIVPTTSSSTVTKDLSSSSHKSSNTNREKIKAWIKEQAKIFDEKYFLGTDQQNDVHLSSNILRDLKDAINILELNPQKGLSLIRSILLDSDLSSFELIHSGLVKALILFLVSKENSQIKRESNIRTFLNSFLGAPSNELTENIDEINFDPKPFSILVNKLNLCVSQLEQFPVRVQDYSTIAMRNSNPFKLINSHFLKINLNRHPSCTNLKQYRGPLIKMDPFTLILSIERYLLTRGYGKIKEGDDDASEDEFSDEDALDIYINTTSHIHSKTRLQLLIGEHVLPYNISLLQGIKQFMFNDLDNDLEDNISNSKLWSSTFYIYYRLPIDANANLSAISPASNRASRKNKSKSNVKKKDELWTDGKIPLKVSPLEPYLRDNLTMNLNINDQSAEVICLLNILYGINKNWGHLYRFSHSFNPAIPIEEFVNSKLTVKANRQLQDPIMILTGTLPIWLSDLARTCPFMFPFEVRHLLFYVICFDRDRALHRLFENAPDLSPGERERSLAPRLERKRKTISRSDIIKSAECVFSDASNLKMLLEIQYENEVGFGLGPTLEFYALVSKEFQRAEFEMWRGEVFQIKNEKLENSLSYIDSNYGLFPSPIAKNTKISSCTKIRHRFKLLGKFMAKALMDSRMIDINLNRIFYKWLLNEESTLTFSDLRHLDHAFYSSIIQLYNIAQRKSNMNSTKDMDLLKLHGGKDLPVTLNNLENYIDLVSHWTLVEGVQKQMEAFREGFNSVFDSNHLKLFYAEELHKLFCGSSYKRWDVKMLIDSCKPDHGFNHESRAIKFLFEILSSYSDEEQRKFLQFLTGFPRLPVGGFKSLNPPFTIVKKSLSNESDNPDCLPSVMTCVNYLKLPDYPTIEVMREKLKIAINEGCFSFHLS